MRSRQPAHPAIISVEEFTQAQLVRRSRAVGGNRGIAKLERTRTSGTRLYLLRGLVRCDICGRKMSGATIRQEHTYYRCLARTLAPGSAALAEHPRTVNLREANVLEPLNSWLGGLFAPDNVDQTVAALLDSRDQPSRVDSAREMLRKRAADADARIRKYQAAIAAGVDPAALVDAINEAQAERAAARAQLDNAPAPKDVTDAEIYAMIDSLQDVGAALSSRRPERLSQVYTKLHLGLRYRPHERAVYASIAPRVASVRVRGGSYALSLSTRLHLAEPG